MMATYAESQMVLETINPLPQDVYDDLITSPANLESDSLAANGEV